MNHTKEVETLQNMKAHFSNFIETSSKKYTKKAKEEAGYWIEFLINYNRDVKEFPNLDDAFIFDDDIFNYLKERGAEDLEEAINEGARTLRSLGKIMLEEEVYRLILELESFTVENIISSALNKIELTSSDAANL